MHDRKLIVFILFSEPLSGVVSLDELSNDDTLSPLERLYSFGKSDIAIHRYGCSE
jgi:hypothetical protein